MRQPRSGLTGKIVVLVSWIALLSLGCSSVMTVHPLPWRTEPTDRERFEGTWLVGDDSFQIRFTDSGVARFAGLDWEDGQFRLEQGEMTICRGEHLGFLSVRTQEDGEWTNHYYLVQFKFTDPGELVLWLPNADAFAEAIAQDRLRGTVDGNGSGTDITITGAPENLLELIDDPEDLVLFDYRSPLVLRRVTVWEPAARQVTPTGAE
jgi:hypothetical protein